MRHERGLFALVGALLLVLNLMQPLAFAGQMQQGVWSICLGNVVDTGGGTEEPAGECPICISGACASASAQQKALQAFGIAFSAQVPEAALAWNDRNHLACSLCADRSQAIRAPPFSI